MLLYCGREGPWSVAGNDGEMAEAQQELTTEKAKGKTSNTTNKRQREWASRTRARAESARKDGIERLRQAADRRVGRNAKELADLLTEKALTGDLPSTKELVRLAEGKKPRPEPVKKKRGPSLAEQLAMEPQWQGPPEYDEETGGGGVEAEG